MQRLPPDAIEEEPPRREDEFDGGADEEPWPPRLALQELSEIRGHVYGDTSVASRSVLVQGGNATVNYCNNVIDTEDDYATYQCLMHSLAFERMGERERNITKALSETCDWIFHHRRFGVWADPRNISSHDSFLWVKGKPGTGKSTMMKRLLSWAGSEWSNEINLSYFFNARSAEQLEKSSIGMYRSLVHQLLSTRRDIRPCFLANFASKATSGKVDTWQVAELQNFLIDLVCSGTLPTVNLFIDALDEGDVHDIRQLVIFLQKTARHAIERQTPLRICLSSRHYPNISIPEAGHIVLESEPAHRRDMEIFIQTHLLDAHAREVNEVRKNLLHKSAGIFLWVVLVVPRLNELIDSGERPDTVLAELDQSPKDLDALFGDILRGNDKDKAKCIFVFQWVLHSMRPLTAEELYAALEKTTTTSAILSTTDMDVVRMNRRLMHYSRGLVEVTGVKQKGSDGKKLSSTDNLSTKADNGDYEDKPVVQFIHETVRSFLLRNNVAVSTLSVQSAKFDGTELQATCSHAVIAESCLRYIGRLNEAGAFYDKIDGFKSIQLLKGCPLAGYAASYWWRHAHETEDASTNRMVQLAFQILTCSDARLVDWLYEGIGFCSRSMPSLTPPLVYASHIGFP
ncbi:hypothetical protein LTR24_010140 [Lithohypha guttulata]|uniref:Nephrocystin 3-like N-terminal domain-containing protein n=1 Tax=Lithohypha guttulata TaxID=1690604 RepID=A0ABR0JUV3_9EURO|nr:hypothetical protein LTR24_010140 [Lithohypha guttulata]